MKTLADRPCSCHKNVKIATNMTLNTGSSFACHRLHLSINARIIEIACDAFGRQFITISSTRTRWIRRLLQRTEWIFVCGLAFPVGSLLRCSKVILPISVCLWWNRRWLSSSDFPFSKTLPYDLLLKAKRLIFRYHWVKITEEGGRKEEKKLQSQTHIWIVHSI